VEVQLDIFQKMMSGISTINNLFQLMQ